MNSYLDIKGDVRDTTSITVPSNRMFRNAWQYSGNAVEVDMVAARELHKDRLRYERTPLLEALDVDFMQALEAGSDTSSVVSSKQQLRDVTDDARIAAATTPEQLAALTLTYLTTE